MASLDDAEEALRSTNAKANFQRLTRLLMCGGVRLLRETFDSIHSPADLPLKLADPAIQAQLRGARLTRPEWDSLYPSPGVYGKSTDFDITLVFRLLRTICNLTPPPGRRGWDDLPNSTDHSLEADLVRIKYFRNEVYGHNKTMEILDNEFVRLWEEISEALLRIAANISVEKRDEWKKSIDDLLRDPLTPDEERYIKELNMWYKQDMDVKNELEKLSDTMEEKFNTLQEELRSQRPVFVAMQIIAMNNTDSFSKAEFSQAAGSEGMCIVPIHPDQRQAAAGTEASSGQQQPNGPPDIHIWNVVLSFKEAIDLFFKYLRCKLNVFVRNYEVGSLLITVECSSLQILEGLWEDYRSGHLNEKAQEMLITPQVLEKLGLKKVQLKTFISEEEYEKGKQIFEDNSAISEQSHSLHDKIDDESESAVQVAKDLLSESISGERTAPTKKEKQLDDDSGHQKELDEATETSGKGKDTEEKISSEGLVSSQDYLERMSKLEQENIQLRTQVAAIEQAFQHEKSKDYLERISKLEQENIQLRTKVAAIEQAFQHEKSKELEARILKLVRKNDELVQTAMVDETRLRLSELQKENYKLEERLATIDHEWRSYYKRLEDLFKEFMAHPFEAGLPRRPVSPPTPFVTFRVDKESFSRRRTLSARSLDLPFGERKGFCQVIINRMTHGALVGEEAEVLRVFQSLGYDVDKAVCEPNNDVNQLIDSVAGRDYSNNNIFVCFILSNVTESLEIESFAGKTLSFTKLMAKFSQSKFHPRFMKAKVFIFLGHQKATTAPETEDPVVEKSITVQLPLGERNLLFLFVPYRKGYLSTLLTAIKLHSSDRDLLYILSEARKSFYEKTNITVPDPVHNLLSKVYLN